MARGVSDAEIGMDAKNLYREETFTDRQIGSVQQLTPVLSTGERDNSRTIVYVGQTQIMTPGGALPLSFEIEAESLDSAVAQFGEQARVALDDTMQKLEQMRREAASSLIVPGSSPQTGPGGGIQIP